MIRPLFAYLLLAAAPVQALAALTISFVSPAFADDKLPDAVMTAAPSAAPAPTVPASRAASAQAADAMRTPNKKDLSQLKTLNEKYRKAKSITMDVTKEVKLGLVGSERKSKGQLELSKGEIRMELDGSEHTLLVVNKKDVFAVTYPDKALKGAATQVIKGTVASSKAKKKSQSSALTNLLGPGGFLKSFKPTGVQQAGAETTYFLSPIGESDMTRAQLKTADNQIKELHYWDARDNETIYQFSNISFDKPIPAKTFDYTPPADADVMNL